MEVLIEIGLIILVTALITGLIRMLRQPLIIGYILSGIVMGPYFLSIIKSVAVIDVFSQIGIALLLFIVGLSLSPKIIKEVGKVSSITGIGQIIFTSLIGFFICRLLGFSNIISLYVAIALTFSSTIIIMKLLSDKEDTATLYGKISIGFLIVQDLFAMLILMAISSIRNGVTIRTFLMGSFLKGVGLLGVFFLIGLYVLPSLTKYIAKSQEFLLLFSISWCLALAALFHYMNFSLEIGALLAGITLSLSPYRHEISSKMKPLRDFFIVLFFIFLGSQMVFTSISIYLPAILILSAFILIGNPLIVMVLMGLLGYTKRNSFLAGLTVAQISEFSLILVALGVKVGHLSTEILSFVTFIGIITIAGSTYMIIYSNKIYPHISKCLGIFEKKGRKVDEHKYHRDESYEMILFGYNRIGYDVLESFKKLKKRFLVVDFDPEVIKKLLREGFDCRYGDANDFEMLSDLNFSKTKMVISTVHDIDTNLLLINKVRESNKNAIIMAVSHQIDDALTLYKAGATYVIMPHFLGGHHAATMIKDHKLNLDKFLKEKVTHLDHLRKREMMGHEHPEHEKQHG